MLLITKIICGYFENMQQFNGKYVLKLSNLIIDFPWAFKQYLQICWCYPNMGSFLLHQ